MHYLLCLKNLGSHGKGFKVYCLKEKNVTPTQNVYNQSIWVESRYKEPPYNEVLGITNNFLYTSNSKIYGKEPEYNETSL